MLSRNAGEPNNHDNNENCAHWRDDRTWNDIICATTMPSLCAFDDGCQTQPCQNGGTCSSRPEGAQCACPSGFTGLACQRLCVEGADSDGDGILDCEDACPHDDSKAEDDDTDGDHEDNQRGHH